MRIDAAPGSTQPALRLNDADGVEVFHSRIPSIDVTGKSKGVRLFDTEAKLTQAPGVEPVTVK
jgi:hypothetical protein